MHDTAYEIGRLFFQHYCRPGHFIVEFGSYNVNGSLRDFCPEGTTYLGLDVDKGPSVDLIVESGRPLPLRDGLANIVVSSSVFEHDQFFWETFLELIRIIVPGGVLYLNAPSNGTFHRYPMDCWRFYPDCGKAFEAFARKQTYPVTLIESFTAERRAEVYNDFVAIFIKSAEVDHTKIRFISDLIKCKNIIRIGSEGILNLSNDTEDRRVILGLTEENEKLRAIIDANGLLAEQSFASIKADLWAQLVEKDAEIADLRERLAILSGGTEPESAP